jgi:large conductance mechanosensitive channel
MAGFAQEFRAFLMRGNVLDLAVAVVIGAAFGRVVSAFVEEILMPPIGLLLGGVDFSWIAVTLKPAVGDRPPVVLGIGRFVQTIVDFVIVGFAIFLTVRAVSRLRREEAAAPAAPPAPTTEERLLTEIRDLLRAGR